MSQEAINELKQKLGHAIGSGQVQPTRKLFRITLSDNDNRGLADLEWFITDLKKHFRLIKLEERTPSTDWVDT